MSSNQGIPRKLLGVILREASNGHGRRTTESLLTLARCVGGAAAEATADLLRAFLAALADSQSDLEIRCARVAQDRASREPSLSTSPASAGPQPSIGESSAAAFGAASIQLPNEPSVSDSLPPMIQTAWTFRLLIEALEIAVDVRSRSDADRQFSLKASLLRFAAGKDPVTAMQWFETEPYFIGEVRKAKSQEVSEKVRNSLKSRAFSIVSTCIRDCLLARVEVSEDGREKPFSITPSGREAYLRWTGSPLPAESENNPPTAVALSKGVSESKRGAESESRPVVASTDVRRESVSPELIRAKRAREGNQIAVLKRDIVKRGAEAKSADDYDMSLDLDFIGNDPLAMSNADVEPAWASLFGYFHPARGRSRSASADDFI